jgi:general secretion pathway protein G
MVMAGTAMDRRGFTLIELLVVLAILALLLTIATPRYIHHVERARETTLHSSLKVMRDAIDKFAGDQGRLPRNLDELVERDYIKSIPIDPITEKRDTWVAMSEAEVLAIGASQNAAGARALQDNARRALDGLADIHSGAQGKSEDGTPYQEF